MIRRSGNISECLECCRQKSRPGLTFDLVRKHNRYALTASRFAPNRTKLSRSIKQAITFGTNHSSLAGQGRRSIRLKFGWEKQARTVIALEHRAKASAVPVHRSNVWHFGHDDVTVDWGCLGSMHRCHSKRG